MENQYDFFAFISYRHTDSEAAKRLQRLLEGYNLPTEIKELVRDKIPEVDEKFPIFRDTDELTSGILSEELQKKLDVSKFLIVICSPESALSKYVGDEIAYFRSLGRERRIIPFIIEGAPHSKDKNCYHPQLTAGGLELLGIDVQAEKGWCKALRFHKAFMRTVAKMLDLDFDILWNKRKRQFIKISIRTAVFSILVLVTILFLAFRAQKEKPFDVQLHLNEREALEKLPLRIDGLYDTLYLYLEEGDIRPCAILDINLTQLFKNIPGRYRNKNVRIVYESFAFDKIDTTFNLSSNIDLNIYRNPESFGRIRYYVKDSDCKTPVNNAIFDLGFMQALTDENGLLDVLVPLKYQQPEGYKVKITYKGKERSLKWQQELDPLLGRTETYEIVLE